MKKYFQTKGRACFSYEISKIMTNRENHKNLNRVES